MARICFNHLTQRSGPLTAVHDLTGTVQPGTINGFHGPNGACTSRRRFVQDHPRRSSRRAPHGREKRSPAISQPVTPLRLGAIAVLIFIVAVAAAFLAMHGWSHTVRQLVHALGHLPEPLRTLIGPWLTHVLNLKW